MPNVVIFSNECGDGGAQCKVVYFGAEYFFRYRPKEAVAITDDGVDFETGDVCGLGGLGALYGIDDGRLHKEWERFANMVLP